jgi:hypothetical protein
VGLPLLGLELNRTRHPLGINPGGPHKQVGSRHVFFELIEQSKGFRIAFY